MNRAWIIAAIRSSAALIVGAGLGFWLAERPISGPRVTTTAPESEPLFYRHPMNPEITSQAPAKDNMGMDYIPVYADDQPLEAPGTVRIDPVVTQSIGVRTALVERRDLAREIHTIGRVDYDEQQIVRLHPKTEGWIEELFVDTTGEGVEADEVLLSIYAPKLVATQQEYLLALQNLRALGKSPYRDVRTGAKALVETALARLRFLDVPEHQIDELRETGDVKKQLHLNAPRSGIAVKVGAREGAYVTPQTELYLIADLSRIWVLVDIFEEELPWVQVGDEAEMEVAAVPGKIFRGELAYIYPYAESRTRTIKARFEFPNENLLLRPEMFADVTIHADRKRDVVAVPSEAVVRSGIREQVFVVRGPGKFAPQEVRLGVSSGGWTEIRGGVEAGEEVVVSAQFLIDSESKLREAAAKMQEVSSDHAHH